jgi:probable F420-dependent oxidoreductase
MVPVVEIYRLAGHQRPAKKEATMHLGIALPFGDIGGDGGIVREFAELAEAEGYQGLTLADHVLGGNPANPASGRAGGLGLFHDPFVAFGFIAACTKKVELSTQVLILAQRQTVLVAKQAASLDVLSGGRFRFGVGVGWNELEFVGLNENFHNRGKRSEEQVQVMKALWADPYVTFEGKWHRLPDVGINPRPPSRKIPLWFGGHMDVTLQRIAKWGDGWMMLSEPPGPKAVAEFDKLRRLVEAEGRDPASVGLEVWTSTGTGTEKDWREEISFWKKAGVTHVTLHNTFGGYHHKRMAGRSMSDHVNAMRRYCNAVADLL